MLHKRSLNEAFGTTTCRGAAEASSSVHNKHGPCFAPATKRTKTTEHNNRRVTFADTRPVVIGRVGEEVEDPNPFQPWYSFADVTRFELTTIQLAKRFLQHDRAMVSSFSATTTATKNDHASHYGPAAHVWEAATTSETDHDFFQQVSDNDEDQQVLQDFYECVHSSPLRLGLERYTVQNFQRDTKKRRAELYTHVRAIQALTHVPLERREKALSFASEKLSRPSRIWARQLATAVAWTPSPC